MSLFVAIDDGWCDRRWRAVECHGRRWDRADRGYGGRQARERLRGGVDD
jgi:hypothetical protein